MTTENLTLTRLSRAIPTRFVLEPQAETRSAIADTLDLRSLRKLRLEGVLLPEGKSDWRLEAKLGATAVQSCVVTLEPVTTRIDTDFVRSYRADLPEPVGDELEMPEDDTIEPLPATLDLRVVMIEALALALPDYPRAKGVELGQAVFAPPGVPPLTDEDARPLAGLAALRDKLAGGGSSSDDDPENGG